jgi:hypothetical protein
VQGASTLIVVVMALSCAIAWAQPRNGLDAYFVGVEGGQSALFVAGNRIGVDFDKEN